MARQKIVFSCKVADYWLNKGALIQPYHYEDYSGYLFDHDEKVAWLCTFSAQRAYYWAKTGRDIEIVRDRVRKPQWAYLWALNIGDRDLMRKYVTNSEWAYAWARDIGDREIMRERVTDPKWLAEWEAMFGKEF